MAESSQFETCTVDRGLVTVAGAVDLDTAAALRRALLSALADLPTGRPLVADLSAVDFIDASGIGVLVGVGNEARRAGGQLVLRSPGPAVRRILQVVHMEDAFPVI